MVPGKVARTRVLLNDLIICCAIPPAAGCILDSHGDPKMGILFNLTGSKIRVL